MKNVNELVTSLKAPVNSSSAIIHSHIKREKIALCSRNPINNKLSQTRIEMEMFLIKERNEISLKPNEDVSREVKQV